MRVICIVIDGFGIGEQEDSYKYGDGGSNTYETVRVGANIPTLRSLGLDNIEGIAGEGVERPLGAYGRLLEVSEGKDTITGHYELMGLIVDRPFKTYPNGFDKTTVDKLQRACKVEFIGNEVASGTEIIDRLGDLHVKTGKPILYTSSDSVLQIAAHTDVMSAEVLYAICYAAERAMNGEVARIIARPFNGKSGSYTRTSERKDFALSPFAPTTLDRLQSQGIDVVSVGKIYDIFNGKGITKPYIAHGNDEAFSALYSALERHTEDAFIFVNLIDTDMLYGHRNDAAGYRRCMEDIDTQLGNIIGQLTEKDVLIVCADHGCDPSTPGTDHTREFTPLLIYGKSIGNSIALGTLDGFYHVGELIEDLLLSTQNGIIISKLL